MMRRSLGHQTGGTESSSGTTAGPTSCRFGPLKVSFDERVLVPRAWTLAQSQWAAEVAASGGPGALLELCAGAGHIGLAAAVLADRELVQVEVDPVAAGYAEANAATAGWSGRVQVRVGPLRDAVSGEERFPVVIADPPYLRTRDVSRFPDDPRLAIDGGEDGLVVVRDCLAVAAGHLASGGALILQVAGPVQAGAVVALAGEGPAPMLRLEETRVVNDERAIMLLRHTG